MVTSFFTKTEGFIQGYQGDRFPFTPVSVTQFLAPKFSAILCVVYGNLQTLLFLYFSDSQKKANKLKSPTKATKSSTRKISRNLKLKSEA